MVLDYRGYEYDIIVMSCKEWLHLYCVLWKTEQLQSLAMSMLFDTIEVFYLAHSKLDANSK